MKKKKRKQKCYNDFSDFKIPPCAKYLGSFNPFVKDGRVVYKNNNRFFFFLTLNSASTWETVNYNPMDPSTYVGKSTANLQINPYLFIIGLFINEVQKGNIEEYKDIDIHEDSDADKFIKMILENQYEITPSFIPSLTYAISNSSAILVPFFVNVEISPINFYIVLMLSRFYNDYGMLFSDNSYVTNDFINNTLANTYLEFYTC